MTDFSTKRLPDTPDAIAPDGSDVRVLLELAGGGLAHFELAPGETSTAVAHRSVEEIWFFLSGRGEMWRKQDQSEEVVPVDINILTLRKERKRSGKLCQQSILNSRLVLPQTLECRRRYSCRRKLFSNLKLLIGELPQQQ